MEQNLKNSRFESIEVIALLIFFLLLVSTLMSACTTVGPGERGVRITLGEAKDEVLPSGVYVWVPFITRVQKISVQTQKAEIPDSEAVSIDTQKMHVHIAVNYRMAPESAVAIVREFGDEDEAINRVLVPNVHEVLKQATAKKTLVEVLSKRDDLKAEVDKTLIQRLAKYGIQVRDVSIINITFSKEFTDSVERKMVAEQEAKQAEYLSEKTRNEAKAAVNKAQGEADSQKLLKAFLTPEILKKLAIEKWNGALPKVSGSGATPFIDMKDLQ